MREKRVHFLVAHTTKEFVKNSLLKQEERQAMMTNGAYSNCGK